MPELDAIEVEITADTTQFVAGMERALQAVEDLQKAYDRLPEPLKTAIAFKHVMKQVRHVMESDVRPFQAQMREMLSGDSSD